MIAANYVRHPEAMQHQRELWSKSKRDTIMMRIAGLIMRGGPVPAWVTAAKTQARALSSAVKTLCRDWIQEAAESRQPTPTGFRAHVAWFRSERQQQRHELARVTLRSSGFLTQDKAANGRATKPHNATQ